MPTHDQIKNNLIEQGKSLGLKPGDLKVLSTDPFFVGSEKDYIDAMWAAKLWNSMIAKRRKPLHLRGFHYWVQSQGIAKPDGEKYAHGVDPAKDWGYLLHCAQIARYLNIGTWENLVDLKHPNPTDYDNYYVGSGIETDGQIDIQQTLNTKLEGLVDEFVRQLINESPKYHTSGYQIYHNEVWCEKQSMSMAIEPACKRYEATYCPLVGQSSVEKVNMCADRAIKATKAGKKVRIFYISDWDRYGMAMVSAVARKIEFFIQENPNINLKLNRLALDETQVKKYNLPKAPKHGEAVVELDALEAIHPGELGKIIESALKPYYDEEKVVKVRAENNRMRDAVRAMLEKKLKPALTTTFQGINLEGMAGDIDLTSVIDSEFVPPEPGHDVKENHRIWMYDSSRTYFEQLKQYKLYKGSREEEEM